MSDEQESPKTLATPRVFDHQDMRTWCQGVVDDLVWIFQAVQTLNKKVKKMYAAVTQVQADFATLKTDVSAKLSDFQAQLAAALNNPNLPADTKAALVALDADMTAFDGTVKATGTTPPAP